MLKNQQRAKNAATGAAGGSGGEGGGNDVVSMVGNPRATLAKLVQGQ